MQLATRLTKLAFKLAKKALVEYQFKKVEAVEYTFGEDGQVPAEQTVLVKCIDQGVKHVESKDSSFVAQKKLLVLSEDAKGLDTYDKVIIAGVEWNVVLPIEDSGYVAEITLTRSS